MASTRLAIEVIGLNYAPEPTGIAPYTTGMARFLADGGHRVHAIVGMPHYPMWKRSGPYRGRRWEERDGAVDVTRVWHPVPEHGSGLSRVGMEAAFAAQAAGVTAACAPDVVIAVSPALLTVGAALKRAARTGAAVGVVVQDLYGRAFAETGAYGARATRTAAALESRLLTRANGVVAIHDSFRRPLIGLGVDGHKITTIRNWSHIRSTPGDVQTLRRELGWRDDETIALHAGNMGAKQGLENVVEAARLADSTGANVRFVLLGDGHQRAGLEQLARGIRRIQFLDPLPRGAFETALSAADVLVLNERPEIAEMCVPSKLTSYFTAGRPVVAASSPVSAATAEVNASGGGVAVPAGDPAMLLGTVRSVAADRTEALAMGLRGQLFSRDMLHEDAARAAYVGWVEGLAGLPARAIPTQDGLAVTLARRRLRGLRSRRSAEDTGSRPLAGGPS